MRGGREGRDDRGGGGGGGGVKGRTELLVYMLTTSPQMCVHNHHFTSTKHTTNRSLPTHPTPVQRPKFTLSLSVYVSLSFFVMFLRRSSCIGQVSQLSFLTSQLVHPISILMRRTVLAFNAREFSFISYGKQQRDACTYSPRSNSSQAPAAAAVKNTT